jgi:hypothetical protein
MALKWTGRRNICMLSSIHDEKMRTGHDKKGRVKQKLEVCIDYNDASGLVDLSNQYILTYSIMRKRMKNTTIRYSSTY